MRDGIVSFDDPPLSERLGKEERRPVRPLGNLAEAWRAKKSTSRSRALATAPGRRGAGRAFDPVSRADVWQDRAVSDPKTDDATRETEAEAEAEARTQLSIKSEIEPDPEASELNLEA